MRQPRTGAEAVLLGLKRAGVDWFFGNAGTDFPSIIEAFAALPQGEVPTPVVVPHESAGVAMAHGYWLATGRPQAVMVHVNVGLANAAMGVINAASDDIPMLVMSGRTPITERGREGSRTTPVQYGQEMFDQASIVSDVVRHHYEMRYPEQGGARPRRAPVILCQRGDPAGRLGPLLSRIANAHGIGVAEPFSVRNLLASDDKALLGYDAGAALEGADMVLVLDCDIPWIEVHHAPGPGLRVAHMGPDPHFRRMPVRGYRADLAIAAAPLSGLQALERALPAPSGRKIAAPDRPAPQQPEGAITVDWLSHCVSQVMDDDAVAFTELGVVPEAMCLKGPNRLLSHAHSGGLGWAMPAALGAQLARGDRLTIAAIGDGSYIFANPLACHQIAEAQGLPILTVIRNNASWNAVRRSVLRAYPDGAAVRANRMPLTSLAPQPDFCAVARASRAHAERVEDPAALPGALARAVEAIRTERRQALVDVAVAVSDSQ